MSRHLKFLIWGLFSITVIYSILDAYQTYWLINVGFTESNPTVNVLMDKIGLVNALALIKSTVLIFLLITIIIAIKLEGDENGKRN